jgi:heterodisulfide reductase subunit C
MADKKDVILPEGRNDFLGTIKKIAGESFRRCFQCGMCSASCPMAGSMVDLPRRIVHMLQVGQLSELSTCNSQWLCSSCYACNVVCPRNVEIPKVMEGLRVMKLRNNDNFVEPLELPDCMLRQYPQIALVAAFRKCTG